MKYVADKLLNVVFLLIIGGAFLTQIPMLLTLSTALYWICAVLYPAGFMIFLVCAFIDVRPLQRELHKTSPLMFGVNNAFTFVTIGVFAAVGWAWPLTWLIALQAFIVIIYFKQL